MATKSELQQVIDDLLNQISHASAKVETTQKVLAQIQQNLEGDAPDIKITLGLAYAAEAVCSKIENDLDEMIQDYDHKLIAAISKLATTEAK